MGPRLGTPLHDDDASFLGYIGGCIDVTDRKRLDGQQLSSCSLTHGETSPPSCETMPRKQPSSGG